MGQTVARYCRDHFQQHQVVGRTARAEIVKIRGSPQTKYLNPERGVPHRRGHSETAAQNKQSGQAEGVVRKGLKRKRPVRRH